MRISTVIQDRLGSCEYLFIHLYRLFGNKKGLLVNKKTNIVIEGFPRSGNTFAVVAFQHAQQTKKTEIAHHLHAAAQIKYAVHNNIPVLLLIRKPLDAISSLIVRDPNRNISDAIDQYIRFHKAIIKYKKNIFVCDFEIVVTDYGAAIRELNHFYKTDFSEFSHTKENVNKVFNELDELEMHENKVDSNMVARPSSGRRSELSDVKSILRSKKYDSKITQAHEIYLQMIN